MRAIISTLPHINQIRTHLLEVNTHTIVYESSAHSQKNDYLWMICFDLYSIWCHLDRWYHTREHMRLLRIIRQRHISSTTKRIWVVVYRYGYWRLLDETTSLWQHINNRENICRCCRRTIRTKWRVVWTSIVGERWYAIEMRWIERERRRWGYMTTWACQMNAVEWRNSIRVRVFLFVCELFLSTESNTIIICDKTSARIFDRL